VNSGDTRHRLTLIHAPAGFGKTRALKRRREAAEAEGLQTVWLALDPSSATPDRFANAIAATLDTVPRLLLIDDFQWAQEPANEALLLAQLRADPNLRIVVASRLGGLAGLSRLRATGEAAVLGPDDLRLSQPEAHTLADGPDDPDVQAWIAAAEGWPILLNILKHGLAAGDQPNRLQVVGAVAADLLDGFVEDEILGSLPPALRAFLLDTCVVSEIDPALGRMLHGPTSEAAIERLTRRHGLLALEPRSGRFRLNPLIRMALLRRRRAAGEADVVGQQRTVHQHLMDRETFDQAVLHACDIGDFAACLDLFRRFSPSLLALRYGLKTVREVLARIPAEHFRSDPALRLSRALLLSKEGRMRDARRMVDEVRASLRLRQGGDLGEGGAELALLDVTLALQAEESVSPEAARTLEAMIGEIPPSDHLHLGWLYNVLCRLKLASGDLEGSAAAAMLALRYYQAAEAPYGVFFIHLHLGVARFWQGRLSQAITEFDNAERLVTRHFNSDPTLGVVVRLLKAEALLDRDGVAGDSLAHDLRHAEENDGWLDVFLSGYRVETLRLFRADAPEAAFDVLRRAGETAARCGGSRLSDNLRALRIECLTFAGRRTQAATLLRQARRETLNGLGEWRERIQLGLAEARLMLHLRQYKRAGAVLAAVETECAAMGASRPLLKARILQALLLAASGARRAAASLLVETLAGAGEDLPIHAFTEEGEAMARLCALAVRMTADAETLDRLQTLHSALAQTPLTPADPADGEPLLTAREREVLLSLSKGWSNKLAAERLNVAEATVKFHLRRIYRKLGAPNRVTALAIAQQHDLLG
jgi:LuxR family maltose regulon positive regulatory protein